MRKADALEFISEASICVSWYSDRVCPRARTPLRTRTVRLSTARFFKISICSWGLNLCASGSAKSGQVCRLRRRWRSSTASQPVVR